MLDEIVDLQESKEEIWGTASLSFNIQTRLQEDGSIIEREYTFSRGYYWDEWTFSEFEERRADSHDGVVNGNWRRTAHIDWYDVEAIEVDVPPNVNEKLEELLNLDEITIQLP